MFLRYQNTDQSNESIYSLSFFQACSSGIKTLISQMNQFTSFFLQAFPSGIKTLVSQMNQFTLFFFPSMFLRYQNTDQSNESIYFFFPSIFLTYQRCIYAEILISFLNTRLLTSHPNKKVILPKSIFHQMLTLAPLLW